MTKTEFLEALALELKRKRVSDAPDILEEYEQHFAFRLAEGRSEEEIAAKLGEPKAIAAQYDGAPAAGCRGGRAAAVIGLGAADLFFGLFCVLLFAWEIIMVSLVVSFGAATVALIANVRESLLVYVPAMPYPCALILSFAFAALTVLSAVGTVCFFRLIRRLMRAFGRFHGNVLASASGRASLPPEEVRPLFPAETKGRLERLALLAAVVFGVCFLAGFAACALSAGAVEFWHSWGWFGYGG